MGFLCVLFRFRFQPDRKDWYLLLRGYHDTTAHRARPLLDLWLRLLDLLRVGRWL
jgi:hypothetical protein